MANKRSKPPIVDTGQALDRLKLAMAAMDAIYGRPRWARYIYQLPAGIHPDTILEGAKQRRAS